MGITQKFKEDLKDGMEYELKVLDKLKENGLNLSKNIDERGVDLVGVFNIEVKRDNKSLITGNYFFETECRGKPSGIFKYSDIKYWVHGTEEKFHIIDIDILRDFVINKGWKVRGGDNNASGGYILNIKAIEDIAISTLFFNNNTDDGNT